eukprot:c7293_g1_i3.p1 GENE.c7293_g1_i3~~c7293_g1_i3.p1  ORF type:complete len:498 (-),score=75.85 c7293_g1_i3:57-1502(-)
MVADHTTNTPAGASYGATEDVDSAPLLTRGNRSDVISPIVASPSGEARDRVIEDSPHRLWRESDEGFSPQANLRRKLRVIEGYTPSFTRFITFAQIIVFSLSLIPHLGGTIAPWGFHTTSHSTEVTVFGGSTDNQQVYNIPNMWIGPRVETLIHWGAKFSPCMRSDKHVEEVRSSIEDIEGSYGCCIDQQNSCGMMSQSSCADVSGTFVRTTNCSTLACHISVRPCCHGQQGYCNIITEDHCDAIHGHFHDDAQLCSHVNCLEAVCGMGGFWGKDEPNQWFRFVTPIFMHVGVLHLIPNLLFQYHIGKEIEATAGFWRMAAIYLISGIGGNIVACLFGGPWSLSTGASSSIYGLIAATCVDLFYSWKLVQHRIQQAIRLLCVVFLVLGIGTLPFIDNFAHVGGFIFGIFVTMVFLPAVEIGTFEAVCKNYLRIFSSIILISLIAAALSVFFTNPDSQFCEWCKYIDCVPYVEGLCDGSFLL